MYGLRAAPLVVYHIVFMIYYRGGAINTYSSLIIVLNSDFENKVVIDRDIYS